MKKWLLFFKERFDPLSHLTMILLFVCAHILFARAFNLLKLETWQYVPLFFAITFFFLTLRFYDEIKDYEHDKRFNPQHPLARGLVTHKDLHLGIVISLSLVLLFFFLCSLQGLLWGLVTVAYSLLMYKEFFIGKIIRPHLTTYAVSHTVVTVLLSLSLFASITHLPLHLFPKELFLFAFVSWFLFNIFEFGRKSYLPSEERKDIASYSKIFGRWGAVGLVLSQAFLVTYLLLKVPFWTSAPFGLSFIASFLLLLIIGSLFCKAQDKSLWGKVYRGFSSLYIVLIYGAIVAYFVF